MSEESQSGTVLVEKYREAAVDPTTYANSYKGLKIHALPGLHEFTAARAAPYLKAGDRVLDLAAGSGAMSLRLSDMGCDVTATDYVAENFRLHGAIPFVPANLNESFANQFGGQFDAIMASEIIEHLENPRHFARECFKLLKQGGHLFLSTPNVNSPSSIVNFMRTGTFTWFGELEYERDGHITPLSKGRLKRALPKPASGFCGQDRMAMSGGSWRGLRDCY